MNIYFSKGLKCKFEKANFLENYAIFLISLVFFYIYYFSLTDFSKVSYYLNRDERLSYDSILSIYQSKSVKEFFESIFFGGDLRYGRLFYNINAIVSYIPYLIFHEQGQIIATRLTQFVAIFLAYFILIHTFLQNKWHKLLAFIVLIFLPKTSYFINEPKPEPLQLLFLSIFLYYAFKNNWKVKSYVIYFGLCVGLKISFIPYTGLFVLLLTFLNRDKIFQQRNMNFLKLIGLVFSISLLFIVYYFSYAEKAITSIFGPNSPYNLKISISPIIYRISTYLNDFVQNNTFQEKIKFFLCLLISFSIVGAIAIKYLSNSFFKILFYILIGVIICTPCILLIPINFKYLFSLIFDNKIVVGMDNPLTHYKTWLMYIRDGLCGAPFTIFISIVFFPILILFLKLFRKQEKLYFFKACLLFLLIMFSICPYFFNVKRFFYHYLYIGYVFLIILYFIAIEEISKNRIISFIALLPLLFFTFYSFKFSIVDLKKYSQRSNPTLEFKIKQQSYFQTVSYLNKINNTRSVVFWDSRLYFPDNLNPNFVKVIFWEDFNDRLTFDYFINKVRQPDFIVLYKKDDYVHSLIYPCLQKTFNLSAEEINSNDYIKREIVFDGLQYFLVDKGFDDYLIYTKK